ncbi:hypothetical protein ILT44_15135 [Microvirga sp. BT689]|uniref:hypothetical protein n=1 Tax=Microvirga arvi TaxID=2778731 RepID=UPI0019526AA0|nr:hypothetical protein [Microvirga arvi]MBM6581529.1 hypothetical protein [Microvirga arvi]
MKLFTIGDSISQGFMSMAAARTELSYSTLLARCMGLVPGTDEYSIPMWGAGGLPFNIENLMRSLQRQYGADIRGPIEWLAAVTSVNGFLDNIEDHYERGQGNIALPQAGRRQFYPNVSVAGFTVADAWKVTPRLCLDRIAMDQEKNGGDGLFFSLPNCRFERTAHAVLNPSRDPQYDDFSQLRWLEHHHVDGEGVENLILWLGANNALGTIVRMDVMSTEEAEDPPLEMDLDQRNRFNLWTTEHFEAEYEELMEKVHDTLTRGKCDCKVFIGTVPAVTIAPLARGVGNSREEDDPFKVLKRATYFDRYTYFLFDHDYARRSGNSLTFEQAYQIDSTIAEYNKTIKRIVTAYNRKSRDTEGPKVEYFLVDICDQLLRLAFKRNHGKPTYELPQEIIDLNMRLGRTVDTVYYTVDRMGRMSAGGVFSLDGVHPTALGHGLIALEFLKAFEKAKVPMVRGLDWNGIAASDSLYTNPISLMPELYDNTRLAELLLDLLRLP